MNIEFNSGFYFFIYLQGVGLHILGQYTSSIVLSSLHDLSPFYSYVILYFFAIFILVKAYHLSRASSCAAYEWKCLLYDSKLISHNFVGSTKCSKFQSNAKKSRVFVYVEDDFGHWESLTTIENRGGFNVSSD